MKPTRKFQPGVIVALEERVVLSQTGAVHAAAAAHVHKAATTKAATFPLNIAATIAAGLPVNENLTIRYGPGSVETENQQINPDPSNSTTTTLETITLPKNGGTETVDDFTYANTNGSTTDVITTDLTNGDIQTETKTSTPEANFTTQISGTISIEGDGVIESYTGQIVTKGAVTTTDKTITEESGTGTEHIVDVQHGQYIKTETDTLTAPNGTRQVTHSTTTLVRLQPTTSASLGASVAPTSIPTISS